MNDLLAPVELEFELSPSENVEALRRHALHTGGFRLTGPIGLGAAGAFVYALRITGWSWSGALGLGGLVLAAAVLLVTHVFPWIAVWRSPRLTKRHKFAFTISHVAFETDDREGHFPWSRYRTWRESTTFYVLYFEDEEFTLIPKRAFDSDDARERFRGLVEHHLGPLDEQP